SRLSRDTLWIGSNFNGEWFSQVRLGENVKIGDDVNLLGHGFIELHDNVQIGNDVSIVTIGHPNDPALRHTAFTGTVIVEEGARIGAGTIISPRAGETLVIPKHARIANDSVILKSIPAARAGEGAQTCSMERVPFDAQGYTVIDTPEKAESIFQSAAGDVIVDIKLPIYFKGDPALLKVVGTGRIGINRGARFDLGGNLTLTAPFQMASRATVQVLPGANAILESGVFVYTAAHVDLKDRARIGRDAIIAAAAYLTRNLEEGDIFVGDDRIASLPGEPRNPKAGRVAGKITDKKYDTVPDEWKDKASLSTKLESYKEFKATKAGMSVDDIIEFASSSARTLFHCRRRPFAAQSVFFAAEFAQLGISS
ncbi:MAG: acyltransferase, partial [Janthinobacterium lividum]